MDRGATDPRKPCFLRFDRLRLTGFKSFVDQTGLVIRDGLTGVVGPNGCGKSKLLEALRWVPPTCAPRTTGAPLSVTVLTA